MQWLLFSVSSLALTALPSAAFAPTTGFGTSSRSVHHGTSSQLHAIIEPLLNDVVATLASSMPSTAAAAAPMMLESTISSALSSSSLDIMAGEDGGILTTENIKTAFSVATYVPQLPWLFLILLPKTGVTKKLLGGYEVITLCCLVHFFIVSASIAQPDGTAPMAEFADVFDLAGDPQKAMMGMMQYPNFVTEEWSHVLTWDLFVGRWIWLDGLKRGIFTSHSILFCNLLGPPGLLLHWATCVLTGKGLPGNEAEGLEEE